MSASSMAEARLRSERHCKTFRAVSAAHDGASRSYQGTGSVHSTPGRLTTDNWVYETQSGAKSHRRASVGGCEAFEKRQLTFFRFRRVRTPIAPIRTNVPLAKAALAGCADPRMLNGTVR